MGEERLTGLALLNIYSGMSVDSTTEIAIDRFATIKKRALELVLHMEIFLSHNGVCQLSINCVYISFCYNFYHLLLDVNC